MFRRFQSELTTIDRVIVNAGLGKGAPIGKGRYDANKATAMTNFVAALAQCEAAMEIFRAQKYGHLVMISSMSAYRGMPSDDDVCGDEGRCRDITRASATRCPAPDSTSTCPSSIRDTSARR